MNVACLTSLADFIHCVVSQAESPDKTKTNPDFAGAPRRIFVFCHEVHLSGLTVPGAELSISQINALRRVSIISGASHDAVLEMIRAAWLEPCDAAGVVWAFYDLVSEWPASALEDAAAVSRVLYMLARSCALKTPPKAVFLNVPAPGETGEARVAPEIRGLVSKWTQPGGPTS